MRGGAIPLLVWSALLGLLAAANAVWTGDGIQVGEFGFAVALVVLFGLALTAHDRAALRRGPPAAPRRDGPVQPVPELSVAPILIACALAAILFGLAFGHFLIYFGCGLLALSLGRLALELRAAADDRRRFDERRAAERDQRDRA